MISRAEHRIIEESEQLRSEVLNAACDLADVLQAKRDTSHGDREYFNGSNYEDVAEATKKLRLTVENNFGETECSRNVPSWVQGPTVSKLQPKEPEENKFNQQSLFSVAAQAA